MEDEEIDWLKIDGELILPVLSSGFKPNATPPVNNEISFIQSKSAGSSAAKAISEHNAMEKNRTWPVAKATKKETISVFVSSSAWYDNYLNFDKIANFPAMQAWLAGDEESPANLDLWGFESDHYTFLDLKKWLKEKVEKRKGKGKGKSKEEKEEKDEGTSERKEKSK
ncbi:hypothetical protein BDQ17DRAFT_1333748 [Cyathus striatus]|nr:hypothetical protein BDQ17DRAFT_1333748 [Cyathus striatus]